jgi:hypothetical protein
MSLVGTYVNVAQNFKLIITEANDANGTGKGTAQWGPHSIPVTLHYHFKNSVGPETNLWVAGNQDDPNQYFAGAGYTSNNGYASIQIGMSLSTENRVDTFTTRLDRQ